jgi:hypothetical protein
MNLTKNNTLRQAIIDRVKELNMSYAELLKDAAERGMKIAPARMSKYVKNKYGGMTEEQVLWVATRLGIYINLNLGKLTVDSGVPKFKITPYNEQEALKMLNRIFSPKNEEKGQLES